MEPPAFVAAGVIFHASGEDVRVLITCVSEMSTSMSIARVSCRGESKECSQVRLDNIIGPLAVEQQVE